MFFTDSYRALGRGWLFRSDAQPAAATVIYFHGNGGNISYCDWVGGA